MCSVYLESDIAPEMAEYPIVEFVFKDPTLQGEGSARLDRGSRGGGSRGGGRRQGEASAGPPAAARRQGEGEGGRGQTRKMTRGWEAVAGVGAGQRRSVLRCRV